MTTAGPVNAELDATPGKRRRCANPHCGVLVSARILACPNDWWALPQDMRHEVEATYKRRGQDRRAHLLAVGAAVRWYRANRAPATLQSLDISDRWYQR